MDFITRLSLFFLLLIVSSCAEMGSISGGPQDAVAPKVKNNGMNPPNASAYFTGKEIQIEFTEFVKLSNPLEKITIQPNDVKVKAELKNKTLHLYLDGEYNENTTYTITLNGAIQDITESNDSLMQYVFSTGAQIDSLSYEVKVVDAYTNSLKKDYTVGIYELKDSSYYKKPLYFTKTDSKGIANFNYIKQGSYKILAFEDMNRDLKWQNYENIGFKSGLIQLDSSLIDTIPLRAYYPQQKAKITSKNFIAPSYVKVGANYDLIESEIFANGKRIEKRYVYSEDSIGFILPEVSENNQLIIRSALHTDTVEIRVLEKNRIAKPSLEIKDQAKSLYIDDTLMLYFSDEIRSIDPTKIVAMANDSVSIPIKHMRFYYNSIIVKLDTNSFKTFKINILDSSILFKNYTGSFASTYDFTLKRAVDLGDIILKHNSNDTNYVYQLKQNNKIVRSFKNLPNVFSVKLVHLEPGEYTVEGFTDANGNGRWDIGDLEREIQPESRFFFKNAIKVRAYWELEVELIHK